MSTSSSTGQSKPRSIRALNDLTLDPRNANRGTARGRELLLASLQDDGAGRSILADRNGVVIAGNKTKEQAEALNLPVRVVETTGAELVVVQRTDLDLTADPRAQHLALGDNRIAEIDLDWDREVLGQLQSEGLNLQALWTPDELERLLGPVPVTGAIPEDATVPLRETTIRPGDLFRLGPHWDLCGDSTNAAHVARVLNGTAPRLMATDPPYGDSYDATWRVRSGRSGRHAVGAVTNDHQVNWQAALQHFLGDVMYVWHAGVHADTVGESLRELGFDLRAQIIWVKPAFVLSRGDYHWQHEPCWYAVRHGRPSHWRGDRTQSTVWAVPNLNPITGERGGENPVTGHSTQKPVALFERPILAHTAPGDAVYDPFAGSGTSIIAAEKTGRICHAIEIEPKYVQAAIDRWEAFTGQTAVKVGGPR